MLASQPRYRNHEQDQRPQDGGNAGADASLGEILGPSFYSQDVPGVISKIIEVYVQQRQQHETFLAVVRRIGIAPFKEHVYAHSA